MMAKSMERVFEAERLLRVAAIAYAEDKVDTKRKALRQAAIVYSLVAAEHER